MSFKNQQSSLLYINTFKIYYVPTILGNIYTNLLKFNFLCE